MINMCLKRVLSVVMMTLMMFSQAANNVYAAGTLDCTISEFIHGADGGLYITISGRAKGSVSVFVYESTIEPTEFSSVNMPVAFEQYDLRPGLTEFEYIIPLPSELEAGSYDIKVVAKDGSYKFIEDYFFLNEEVVQAAKDEVNAAILVSPYAVSEALSANADNLLIDQTDINTYGGFASELLFSRRDSEGQHIQYETIEDLIKAFSEAKAIYIVENRGSDKTLEKAIEENKSALGISLTAGYQINLTDSAKAELYVLLEDNKEWKTKPYSNVYKEMTALASVKKAESWSTLKSVVTDWYKDIININTTKYAKILDDIFVEMIKYQCDTFEDIKIKFDLAVDTVKDDSSGS
ncbi:MAG: hypothetical protein IKV88_07945, partial [Clostridia bacterium]|nr:hypothetical protein [Clostridia bacterium]